MKDEKVFFGIVTIVSIPVIFLFFTQILVTLTVTAIIVSVSYLVWIAFCAIWKPRKITKFTKITIFWVVVFIICKMYGNEAVIMGLLTAFATYIITKKTI